MAGLTESKSGGITKAKEDIEKIKDFNKVVIVVGVFGVLTLLVTVSGLVIDAYRFKISTYQTLVDKVNLINEKIDNQNNLDSQIKILKERNSYLK